MITTLLPLIIIICVAGLIGIISYSIYKFLHPTMKEDKPDEGQYVQEELNRVLQPVEDEETAKEINNYKQDVDEDDDAEEAPAEDAPKAEENSEE